MQYQHSHDKNSHDFIKKIKALNSTNCTMLSLDMKSLFINFPIEGGLNCLEQKLREFNYSDIRVQESVNLTKIYISKIFVFNDKYGWFKYE